MDSEFQPDDEFTIAFKPTLDETEIEIETETIAAEEGEDIEEEEEDEWDSADYYEHSYQVIGDPSMIQRLWVNYLLFWGNMFGGWRSNFDEIVFDEERQQTIGNRWSNISYWFMGGNAAFFVGTQMLSCYLATETHGIE